MSSLFASTYTDPCGLHRYIDINDKGDAEYDPSLTASPLPFMARFEYKRREVLDKDGNKVLSEARLFTETEMPSLSMVVRAGQYWTVKTCAPISGLFGRIDHYEVTL